MDDFLAEVNHLESYLPHAELALRHRLAQASRSGSEALEEADEEAALYHLLDAERVRLLDDGEGAAAAYHRIVDGRDPEHPGARETAPEELPAVIQDARTLLAAPPPVEAVLLDHRAVGRGSPIRASARREFERVAAEAAAAADDVNARHPIH